tara:strand:- start:1220 stop:1546 length:327 start_codon:yes stop_codon:yes gene_type:complete
MKNFTIEDRGYILTLAVTEKDDVTEVSVSIPLKDRNTRLHYWTTGQLVDLIHTKIPNLGNIRDYLDDWHHAYADRESGVILCFVNPKITNPKITKPKPVNTKNNNRKN